MSFLVLDVSLLIFVLFDGQTSSQAFWEAETCVSLEGTKEVQKDSNVEKVEPIVGMVMNCVFFWAILGAIESKVGLAKKYVDSKKGG